MISTQLSHGFLNIIIPENDIILSHLTVLLLINKPILSYIISIIIIIPLIGIIFTVTIKYYIIIIIISVNLSIITLSLFILFIFILLNHVTPQLFYIFNSNSLSPLFNINQQTIIDIPVDFIPLSLTLIYGDHNMNYQDFFTMHSIVRSKYIILYLYL